MTDQYLGEIRIWPGQKCPTQWHFCDGTLLPISANEALFNLIGTVYGGDGQNNFALPDLRGRVPIHYGQGPAVGTATLTNRPLGSFGGNANVALSSSEMPDHSHSFNVANVAATATTPGTSVLLALPVEGSNLNFYETTGHGETIVQMNSQMISGDGGSGLPHSNLMPTMALNFIIALFGVIPLQPN